MKTFFAGVSWHNPYLTSVHVYDYLEKCFFVPPDKIIYLGKTEKTYRSSEWFNKKHQRQKRKITVKYLNKEILEEE